MYFHQKPFIVAELGASHLGSFNRMLETITAAAKAGADAVKFQTYTPDEISVDVPIESGPWADRSYHDLYLEAMVPWEWHNALFNLARKLGLVPFSTPFSEAAVARLETIHCPMYKIASPEIVHHRLIAAAARTGKPLIISAGMATIAEIKVAQEIAAVNGSSDATFLHCISAYPAEVSDFNLNSLNWYKFAGIDFGLSDHSLGSTAAVTAVALGASVIEKHFCLSRADGGPDAAFSLMPHEFHDMVKQCRDAYSALGESVFGVKDCEQTSLQYRPSIWLVKPIKAGEALTSEHLAIRRPNYGLPPGDLEVIIGKKVNRTLEPNTPMTWDLIV